MFPDKKRITIAILLLTSFLSYSFFLYKDQPLKKHHFTVEAEMGMIAWQKYNCISCHQVYGLGGYLGPDLTNTYSLKGPTYITAFLKSGTDIMPDFKMTDAEIKALTAFMKALDASGVSDPRSFKINFDGTISQ